MLNEPTYPFFFFHLFVLLGLILFVKKPQYIFWIGVFYFSARELKRAVFTRLPQFGSYLNLDDFIILIMLLLLIRISFSRRILMPSAIFWLSICLFYSILLIVLNYSFIYPVQRAHKYALYFLFGIFLGYNYVWTEKDLKIFLYSIFIGSIIASIQYIINIRETVLTFASNDFQFSNIRSVQFIGLIPAIIISSVFIKLQWLKSKKIIMIFLVGLSLMIINIILSQTRSITISIILTIIIIYFKKKEIRPKVGLILLVPFFIYIIFIKYLDISNINEIFFERFRLFTESPGIDITSIARKSAIAYEFNAFLTSNIIFGNGLGYFYFHPEAYNPYIAWGHIGHISYLATLGVFGFMIYSMYIPYISLRVLLYKKINTFKLAYTKMFIIFGTALIISNWISFWMSSSYLENGSFLPGTVIGIVWALKDNRIALTKH